MSRVLASIALPPEANPRDGTTEFIGVADRRYHLRSTATHAVTDELPVFPEAFQNVAQLQMVEAREEADVLLAYVTGIGTHPIVSSPALAVQPFGMGRVAVLASPVDWGGPRFHVTWSRLGEYHRQMFTQLALWLVGG